jgi:hypothetical protein
MTRELNGFPISRYPPEINSVETASQKGINESLIPHVHSVTTDGLPMESIVGMQKSNSKMPDHE